MERRMEKEGREIERKRRLLLWEPRGELSCSTWLLTEANSSVGAVNLQLLPVFDSVVLMRVSHECGSTLQSTKHRTKTSK